MAKPPSNRLSFFSLLSLHCENASRLSDEALDRPLSRMECVGLNAHVLICRSCRIYRTQIRTIRKLLVAFCSAQFQSDDITLPLAARHRIERALNNRSLDQ